MLVTLEKLGAIFPVLKTFEPSISLYSVEDVRAVNFPAVEVVRAVYWSLFP